MSGETLREDLPVLMIMMCARYQDPRSCVGRTTHEPIFYLHFACRIPTTGQSHHLQLILHTKTTDLRRAARTRAR